MLPRICVACAVLLTVVAYVAVRGMTGDDAAVCTARAAGAGAGGSQDAPSYRLKPVQAANAATIAAVASRRGLPARAVTIALATAMQESQLRNITHGDRDSVGLFQQRPSQGWGTVPQISDPVYAVGKFYDHLVDIPGYARLPLTVAAQRVQRSGYPQAYAKHETNAALLTAALTGREAATLSCTAGARKKGASGDPAQVRERLTREFGRDVLADGTGSVGTSAAGGGSAHGVRPAGHAEAQPAVSVPAEGRRQGWELAHWAVANAEGLHITRISFGGREWSADRSREGWRSTGEGDAKGGSSRGPVRLLLAAGH
nr:heavy metal transporter [Streptomyces diacarni]